MNKTKGLVSICIPTYNGERYLKKSIDSVINQSYRNLEIIITDDISLDDTEKIVHSFDDERIRFFVNSERKGLAGNWNEAVLKASGEYIKILCQDDILSLDAIEKQVKALDSSDASCVIGNSQVINSEGHVIFYRKYFKRNELKDGFRYARKSLLGRNIYSEPGNILYRAECVEKYGLYDSDLKYTPDWDFALRISVSEKIYCLRDSIFSFRVSDVSETSRLYREQIKSLVEDTDKLIDKCARNPDLRITFFTRIVFKFNIRILALIRGLVITFSKMRNN